MDDPIAIISLSLYYLNIVSTVLIEEDLNAADLS